MNREQIRELAAEVIPQGGVIDPTRPRSSYP
jgi:hypothetical protein